MHRPKEVVLIGRALSGKSSVLRFLATAYPAATLVTERDDFKHRGLPMCFEIGGPDSPSVEIGPRDRKPTGLWNRLWRKRPRREASDLDYREIHRSLDDLKERSGRINIRTTAGSVFYWREQLKEDLVRADEIIWVLDVQPNFLSSAEIHGVNQASNLKFLLACLAISKELEGGFGGSPWSLLVTKRDLLDKGSTVSPKVLGWPLATPLPSDRFEVSTGRLDGWPEFVDSIGRPKPSFQSLLEVAGQFEQRLSVGRNP